MNFVFFFLCRRVLYIRIRLCVLSQSSLSPLAKIDFAIQHLYFTYCIDDSQWIHDRSTLWRGAGRIAIYPLISGLGPMYMLIIYLSVSVLRLSILLFKFVKQSLFLIFNGKNMNNAIIAIRADVGDIQTFFFVFQFDLFHAADSLSKMCFFFFFIPCAAIINIIGGRFRTTGGAICSANHIKRTIAISRWNREAVGRSIIAAG